jgi:hypothetical protein
VSHNQWFDIIEYLFCISILIHEIPAVMISAINLHFKNAEKLIIFRGNLYWLEQLFELITWHWISTFNQDKKDSALKPYPGIYSSFVRSDCSLYKLIFTAFGCRKKKGTHIDVPIFLKNTEKPQNNARACVFFYFLAFFLLVFFMVPLVSASGPPLRIPLPGSSCLRLLSRNIYGFLNRR